MNAPQIMVDIETFGPAPSGQVIAIGACQFDPVAGVVEGQTFEDYVELDTAVGKIDPGTVLWWMQQTAAARAVIIEGRKRPLSDVLLAFGNFLLAVDPDLHLKKSKLDNGGEKSGLWSYGPTFDESCLRYQFEVCGMKMPVHPTRSRCFYTMKQLAIHAGWDYRGWKQSRPGTHHNPLHDAQHQATAVCQAYEALGLSKSR